MPRPKGRPRPRPRIRTEHAKVDVDENAYVDFKDTELLKRFVNEQGKIMPRRVTGVSAKFQRQLTRAIKRARHLALMPYVNDTVR